MAWGDAYAHGGPPYVPSWLINHIYGEKRVTLEFFKHSEFSLPQHIGKSSRGGHHFDFWTYEWNKYI